MLSYIQYLLWRLRLARKKPLRRVKAMKSVTPVHTSCSPEPSTAELVSTCGRHPESGSGKRCSAFSICRLASLALVRFSPSALVMTTMSAISMMPRLMPCNSSPAPEI